MMKVKTMKKMLMISMLLVLGVAGACGDDDDSKSAAEQVQEAAEKTGTAVAGDIEEYCSLKKKLDDASDKLPEATSDEENIKQLQEFAKDHASDIAALVAAAPADVRPKIAAIVKGLEDPENAEAIAAVDDEAVEALDARCE